MPICILHYENLPVDPIEVSNLSVEQPGKMISKGNLIAWQLLLFALRNLP